MTRPQYTHIHKFHFHFNPLPGPVSIENSKTPQACQANGVPDRLSYSSPCHILICSFSFCLCQSVEEVLLYHDGKISRSINRTFPHRLPFCYSPNSPSLRADSFLICRFCDRLILTVNERELCGNYMLEKNDGEMRVTAHTSYNK